MQDRYTETEVLFSEKMLQNEVTLCLKLENKIHVLVYFQTSFQTMF